MEEMRLGEKGKGPAVMEGGNSEGKAVASERQRDRDEALMTWQR